MSTGTRSTNTSRLSPPQLRPQPPPQSPLAQPGSPSTTSTLDRTPSSGRPATQQSRLEPPPSQPRPQPPSTRSQGNTWRTRACRLLWSDWSQRVTSWLRGGKQEVTEIIQSSLLSLAGSRSDQLTDKGDAVPVAVQPQSRDRGLRPKEAPPPLQNGPAVSPAPRVQSESRHNWGVNRGVSGRVSPEPAQQRARPALQDPCSPVCVLVQLMRNAHTRVQI